MLLAKILCASCVVISWTAFAEESEIPMDEMPAFGIKTDIFDGRQTDDVTINGCYSAYGNTLHDGNGQLHFYGDMRYATGDSREACGNNDYEYRIPYGWVTQKKFGGYCFNLAGTPAWYIVTFCK